MIAPSRILKIAASLAVLAGAATWTWNTVRHARVNLVTMSLRNAPLPEVLRKMERQTRESLVWDTRLQGTVTADFKSVPLADALIQVAEQVGGFAQTIDAVHREASALDSLKRLLAEGKNPETEGWVPLSTAPEFPPTESATTHLDRLSGVDREALERGERRVLRWNGPPPSGGSFPSVVQTESEAPSSEGDVTSTPNQGRVVVAEEIEERAPGEQPAGAEDMPRRHRRIRVGIGSGTDGTPLLFDVSPERRLLHRPLHDALSPEDRSSAVSLDPAALARRCRANWTRIFALMAAPIPGLSGMQRSLSNDESADPEGKTPRENLSLSDLPGRAEATARRHQFERLSRLSPEQRAREAAQLRSQQP